jgi:NTP pyrophosphatase (non-canonical NTP hydrolase)
LADILIYCLLLCEEYNLDFKQIISDKITSNEKKYPVDKAKGNAKKYTEFE